jgi:N-acyl homoserine lactone hydrolase
MRVHVIQTGRLLGNRAFMRGEGWSSMFRRREICEFPVFSYIVEHPEGHIAIDTGLNARGWQVGPITRQFVPSIVEVEGEIGAQMNAKGLTAEDVRRVVLTHLDMDHVGGAGHFPNAEIWVHRPEYEFASTPMGKWRYRPKRTWPTGFDPKLYDLDDDPCGPFPKSKALTDGGDVRLVPIPGHSIAQVGAIVRTNGVSLFFTADHMLRQDWFLDDYEAGRITMVSRLLSAKLAAETSRRIQRFVDEVPTVLVPAHDTEAPARLAAMEPVKVPAVLKGGAPVTDARGGAPRWRASSGSVWRGPGR